MVLSFNCYTRSFSKIRIDKNEVGVGTNLDSIILSIQCELFRVCSLKISLMYIRTTLKCIIVLLVRTLFCEAYI